MGQHLGDTALTKVFVGGLAWETQEAALRKHFDKCGEILEAVVICDKISGRSKGYGFVTFKEAEAAKKACEDATPVINGRRANCNIASLGAKRWGSGGGGAFVRPSPPSAPAPFPSHRHGYPAPEMATVSRVVPSGPPAAPWFYPQRPTSGSPPPPSPFQLPHYNSAALPFYPAAAAYGYSANYNYLTDLGYTASYKCSTGGGGGMGMGYFPQPLAYPPPPPAADGMVPMYPVVYQGTGFPAHFFTPTSAAVVTAAAAVPAVVSKPPPAVEQVKGGGS